MRNCPSAKRRLAASESHDGKYDGRYDGRPTSHLVCAVNKPLQQLMFRSVNVRKVPIPNVRKVPIECAESTYLMCGEYLSLGGPDSIHSEE